MTDSAEQHRVFKRGLEHEARRARSTTPLHLRLEMALREARGLSEATTGNTEGVIARGKPEASQPPDGSGLLFGEAEGSVYDVYVRRFRAMIESLEREVDAHKARPHVYARETREEKDKRLIDDFRGDPPHLVSFMDPSLGSPRSVERARVRMNCRPRDGVPNED